MKEVHCQTTRQNHSQLNSHTVYQLPVSVPDFGINSILGTKRRKQAVFFCQAQIVQNELQVEEPRLKTSDEKSYETERLLCSFLWHIDYFLQYMHQKRGKVRLETRERHSPPGAALSWISSRLLVFFFPVYFSSVRKLTFIPLERIQK